MMTTGQRLAGQHVFVTGASRGIGRAMTLALAAEGATLTVAATDRQLLDAVAAQCAELGADLPAVQVLDVTDRAACFAAIETAAARAPVTALLNAAGVYRAKPFLSYEPEDLRFLLDVNLYGTLHLMQAVLPGMIERRYGRIVNIASTAGKWASAGQSFYNVSKHAVVGLTRCAALEMGQHGVCINAICPGLIRTDMLEQGFGTAARAQGKTVDELIAPTLARVAMKRVLQPDELTAMAVLLASPESGGMTGQTVVIDGGMLYV